MNTLARHTRPDRGEKTAPRRRASRAPLLWWALVMVLALLSFYVHVLQEQVLRGEQERVSQHPEAQAPAPRAASSQRTDPVGEAHDLLRRPPARPLRVGASR